MRLVMAAVFAAGVLYLVYLGRRPESPPPGPDAAVIEAKRQAHVLPPAELARMRAATADPDASVRWPAIEMLCALKDPGAVPALERAVASEQDPSAKLKAIGLLARLGGEASVPGLTAALRDADKDVRLAALAAIGDAGEPAAGPAVTEALKDPEADVRAAALRALGRVQDRRRAEYQRLARQLQEDQEAARRRKQLGLPIKLERPKEIKVE